MVRYETIKIYNFEELKPDVQIKVLEKHRYINDMEFLEGDLLDGLYTLLEDNKITYTNIKLYYDLSYTQGSGLCFIGDFLYKDLNIKITHNSNYYYHQRSVHYDIIQYKGVYYPDIKEINEEKEINIIFEEFKQIYLNICKSLENDGYSIIEYNMSDEAVKDTIIINDFEFLENGERWYK